MLSRMRYGLLDAINEILVHCHCLSQPKYRHIRTIVQIQAHNSSTVSITNPVGYMAFKKLRLATSFCSPRGWLRNAMYCS